MGTRKKLEAVSPAVTFLTVPATDLFAGGGEMSALMRSTDWSKTKLGPIENWPRSLKTMLGVVLGSRFPMLLWWGPELLHLYNDAYRPILRDKHPASLAAPAAQVWAEIWDVAGPLAKSVQEGGPATWTEDLQLFISSGGMAEETYFTFSYSPVPGDDGAIGGLLNTVQETTAKVQGERQSRMLHDLSARAAEAKAEEDAYGIAAQTLSANTLDLPFVLFYLLDDSGEQARLVADGGWVDYEGAARAALIPTAHGQAAVSWPLAEVVRTSRELVVEDLAARFGPLPAGRWSAGPERAIILPLTRAGRSTPYALMVAGISPHRALDDRYLRFFQATADQVMAVIAAARAYEAEKNRAEAFLTKLTLANQDLESFSSSVSHDLRAPLRALDGFAGILEEDHAPELNEEARRKIKVIRDSVQRMTAILDALLALSRIGYQAVHKERFDTEAFVGRICQELTAPAEGAKADVSIGALPPTWGDQALLRQVWVNLISNALKYSATRPRPRVQIDGFDAGEETIFSIKDNGVGFDMRNINRLFIVFQRLHRSDEFSGTGVGLAVVKRIVEKHGGRVWAESAVDEGAAFFFSLPRSNGPAD